MCINVCKFVYTITQYFICINEQILNWMLTS